MPVNSRLQCHLREVHVGGCCVPQGLRGAFASQPTNTLRFIQERRRGPDNHLPGAHRLTVAFVYFGPTSCCNEFRCASGLDM